MPVEDVLLASVRSARRALAEAGPDHVRSEGHFERVSLPMEDCDALRDLLVMHGADVVIEIGLAYGSSALAVAEALLTRERRPSTQHLIIDPYQHLFGDAGRQALAEAGLDELCVLVTERSQLALPRLLSDGFLADAAFVDGSHTFHNVFVDLYFLRELVRPGGLIVLDDCQWPSVGTAVRYFELNTGWEAVTPGGPTRLRAFRLPDPTVEPNFEDFRPFGG